MFSIIQRDKDKSYEKLMNLNCGKGVILYKLPSHISVKY